MLYIVLHGYTELALSFVSRDSYTELLLSPVSNERAID